MQERLDRLDKQIAAQKMAATATLADRYKKNITYKPVAVTEIATVDGRVRGPDRRRRGRQKAEDEESREEPKKKSGGFGLGKMMPTGGGEKKQAQVTGVGRRARSGSREGLEGRAQSEARAGEARGG